METQIADSDVNKILTQMNTKKERETEDECEFPLYKKLKKKHYNYENNSSNFILTNPTYTQQFSSIYSIRISIMRKLLIKTLEKLNVGMCKDSKGSIKQESDEDVKGNIKQENEENEKESKYHVLEYLKDITINEKCYCIGTIFKKMDLRPSILKEYISEIDYLDTVINYSQDQDVLFLEDETARLKLEGNINSDHYVTGLTVIIKGVGMSNGSMHVDELIYAYLPKIEIPKCISNDDKYILFVSGLYINEQNTNINNISLLRNFILGLHGDKFISQNLIRLVIVGNSLGNINTDVNDMNIIDTFLSSLCSSVYVDLMPGEKDPSDSTLPQQPFPNMFFKKSKKYDSFQCVTNPYMFSIDNVNVCCMSGEPVNNITSFSKITKLDALKMIAKSRILSPTSPDTLGCYPYIDNDPFCIQDDNIYPHIFVNGNCSKLEMQYLENENKLPFLVCLPDFSVTPKALAINIKNMEYKILSFNIQEGE
ncbi:DNA polymerase delta small subunit, putative [Plasmodium vinckei lentum]|uniref:DNA polymerase delta small subunit, putative n=1 Tax=Plasmodium vinckei lentum TaxID=138297 RepID=A0A6V7RVH2_PLAVN|nr:DNA polymerase delta small subunit, putative [Plasmodium vinckei lentum]